MLIVTCPLDFVFFLVNDAGIITIPISLFLAYLGLISLKTSMKISYGKTALIWIWVVILLSLIWFVLLFSTLIFGPRLR